jgi:hypothetical protein
MNELALFILGFAIGWYVRKITSKTMFASVSRTNNYVNQSGVNCKGDMVGGDLVKTDKNEPCEYCGGR